MERACPNWCGNHIQNFETYKWEEPHLIPFCKDCSEETTQSTEHYKEVVQWIREVCPSS